MEPGFRDPAPHDSLAHTLARPHQRDGFGLTGNGGIRGPVPAVIHTLRVMQLAVPFQCRDGAFGRASTVTLPGSHPSVVASRSAWENTASRSLRCFTAQAAASAVK